ncbi:MAG: hypothetical protein II894_07145 [Bacteroidales bacterium]|nr:hypothetical protein [Bacteroidales bacterium]
MWGERPQSDKYLLWGLILREERENLPLVRFNGDRCRFTLISMNNAMIKDVDGNRFKAAADRTLTPDTDYFVRTVAHVNGTEYMGDIKRFRTSEDTH